REAQHHLSAQRRIRAQLAIVKPVQRRLVTIEHDLNFFVGPAGERARAVAAAAGERSTAAATGADGALDARRRDARDLRAAAVAAADVTRQRRQVDAAARARRLRRHDRALGQTYRGCAVVADARVGTQSRRRAILGDRGEAFAEREQAALLRALARRGLGRRRRRRGRRRRLGHELLRLGRGLGHHFRLGLRNRLRFLGPLLRDLRRRRGRQAVALDELDDALGHFQDLGRLGQRQVDERHQDPEQHGSRERGAERAAEAPVVLAAARPWHGAGARDDRLGLALEDPLVQLLFLLRMDLGEIVLENREHLAALRDLVGNGLAAALDLGNARRERVEARAHGCHMPLDVGALGLRAPEELGGAERRELLERAASDADELVLLALRGELLELTVDRAQALLETAELLLGRLDLRAQWLGLAVHCCVHAANVLVVSTSARPRWPSLRPSGGPRARCACSPAPCTTT